MENMIEFDKTFLTAVGKAKVCKYKCLEHIYHSPKTGKFVATDAHILLAYPSGVPHGWDGPSWYTTKGEPATVDNAVDIDAMMERRITEAVDPVDISTGIKGVAVILFDGWIYPLKQFTTAVKWCGESAIVKKSKTSTLQPLYFKNTENEHEALVMPLDKQYTIEVGGAEFETVDEAKTFAGAMGLPVNVKIKGE